MSKILKNTIGVLPNGNYVYVDYDFKSDTVVFRESDIVCSMLKNLNGSVSDGFSFKEEFLNVPMVQGISAFLKEIEGNLPLVKDYSISRVEDVGAGYYVVEIIIMACDTELSELRRNTELVDSSSYEPSVVIKEVSTLDISDLDEMYNEGIIPNALYTFAG